MRPYNSVAAGIVIESVTNRELIVVAVAVLCRGGESKCLVHLSDGSWVSETTHGHVRARDSVVNTFVIIPSLCCWELFALLNHPRVMSILYGTTTLLLLLD